MFYFPFGIWDCPFLMLKVMKAREREREENRKENIEKLTCFVRWRSSFELFLDGM